MEDQSNQTPRKHIQYAFFMQENGKFFSCDADGERFLRTIDVEAFYSHLQGIRLNAANITSTIIINNTSYNLRLLSINSLEGPKGHSMLHSLQASYIVILQNQSFFSSIIHNLNKAHFEVEQFRDILECYSDGIFITRADNTALFLNSHYEETTGISYEDVVGENIVSMESKGLFTPLITPTILESGREYTVIQAFKTGKYAIISGSPIYDAMGNTVLILICITPMTEPHLIRISQKIFDPSKKPAKDMYCDTQIDVIAESQGMRKVIQDVVKVAHFDVPVLLLGSSGTGKEVLSSIIHTSSNRRYSPFIKVNCSAISSSLLEAELFGYEPNSFTGASPKGKMGLFEAANNGTILLDEIGDMHLDSQAKLLRVLQCGEIHRIGSWEPVRVNTRIIAATNRNLRKMVREGTFRGDLYHRLNVVSIHLPDLKDRWQDVVPLLMHYCYIFNKKYGTNKSFSPELQEMLKSYQWPGNVRELRNLVERMVILCIDDVFYPEHFQSIYLDEEEPEEAENGEPVSVKGIPLLSDAVAAVETIVVDRALKKAKNTRKAAELLGVSQSTIMRKIKEYDLYISDRETGERGKGDGGTESPLDN